jgi:gamma-glutamyltranspeptidase/glutathione hydrolase
MSLVAGSFSSDVRPVLRGRLGGVSAAHPLAVAAGQEMLLAGGSAADAAIAAQAALCVLTPDACGLGGDMLALVHVPGAPAWAINGAGAAPSGIHEVAEDGPDSITVPGIVDAWCVLSKQHGRLPLARVLEPAVRLANASLRVSAGLAETLSKHRGRLERGGAQGWSLFDRQAGDRVNQARLGVALQNIGTQGRDAFYGGRAAIAISRAVRLLGGTLSEGDLETHESVVAAPLETAWKGFRVAVQPPMSQGVLLSMALHALPDVAADLLDHVGIELTEAAFGYRADVEQGAALLEQPLPVDLRKASHRGGPRAYLHTAGVAASDADGGVISSLVSVFDDFGSCVYVPDLGITLNNRAGGFTSGANAPAPGKRPVHTLAPILLQTGQGMLGLATPGADGQVQTLLQVLMGIGCEGLDLAHALARPRWRSEGGKLFIEVSHPRRDVLGSLDHHVTPLPDGEVRFGAVVCAGFIDEEPVVAADWRRETFAAVT